MCRWNISDTDHSVAQLFKFSNILKQKLNEHIANRTKIVFVTITFFNRNRIPQNPPQMSEYWLKIGRLASLLHMDTIHGKHRPRYTAICVYPTEFWTAVNTQNYYSRRMGPAKGETNRDVIQHKIVLYMFVENVITPCTKFFWLLI